MSKYKVGRYVGLLATAVLVVALAGCQPDEVPGAPDAKVRKRPPVLVEVWEAQLQTVADRVESIGTLAGNESVTITAKVTEQVAKVHFEDGQMTEAGDVLVELQAAEQRALYSEAEANLKEARLQLERLQRLGRDISTGAQIDVAVARVKANSARLQAIKARVEDRTIRAPFTGQLGFRRVSTGALVTPGTVIAQLDDIRVLKLDFTIPEARLGAVQVGNAIKGTSVAWPGELFVGEVVSVGSRVDSATRAIAARAKLDNTDLRLRPGMLINVELLTSEREELVLPEQALIQTGATSAVYRIDQEGLAQRVEVSIGKRVQGGVVVLAGLEIGDRVVVTGQFNLRSGSIVRIQEAAEAP